MQIDSIPPAEILPAETPAPASAEVLSPAKTSPRRQGVPAGLREELFRHTKSEQVYPARGILMGLLLGGAGWAAILLLLLHRL